MSQQITLLYFGHLAEMLHRESEYLFLPHSVKTLGELTAYLARRGEEWTKVFAAPRESMRITVNKQFAEDRDMAIKPGDEIAFVAFAMT